MNIDRRNDASGVGSLAKNTLFLYLMSLSSQVINLVLIPFQTRVLGSEAYGVISLAVSMSSIVTIVLDFGFILSATERVVGLVGDRPGLSRLLSNVAHAKAMLALALGVIVTALIVLDVLVFSSNQSCSYSIPDARSWLGGVRCHLFSGFDVFDCNHRP